MKIVKSYLAIALVALCLHNVSAQDSTAFAGTVVSVSDTSITVKTAQGDKTLAIDSSTQLVDIKTPADIKVGQDVGIRCDLGVTKAMLIRNWPSK